MNEPIIIVESNWKLACSLALVFRECNCKLFIVSLDGTWEYVFETSVPKKVSGINGIQHCRLAVIHETKLRDLVPSMQQKTLWSCGVFYSTITGRRQTHKTESRWEYWIYRGVATNAPGLSVNEGKELYEWAEHCREEEMPAILKAPPDISYLPALAILCQGYLTVQVAPDGTLEVDDPDRKIAEAVKEMKWDKVLSSDEIRRSLDPRLTADDPKERVSLREIVADPSFWNVFAESHTEEPATSVKLLSTAVNEWNAISGPGDFEPVRRLAVKLESSQDPVLPATLVAAAYLELVKKLGGTNGS